MPEYPQWNDVVYLFCLHLVLTVGFDRASYSATEGQDIVFTVILSGRADIEVTVTFLTRDDTAEGKSEAKIISRQCVRPF